MTASATITKAQAWAIANVLNDAGMDVAITDNPHRPTFTGATGAQLIAAAMVVTAKGGRLAETMPEASDWLMATFEDGIDRNGAWSSLELGWTE